jgi:hypothetical protein
MKYTAKQIDKMSIDEIEKIAQMLNETELDKWASNGYSGASYVEIIKSR